MFIYVFLKVLPSCLQAEPIVKKITQPKLPKTKNELTKTFNELGKNLQIVLAHSAMPPSALLRPKQLRLRSGTGTGSRLQRSAQRTTKLVVAVSAQQTLLFCNKIQLRYFVCTYLLGRKAFRFIFRASHASFCFVFFFLQKKKGVSN